jgi:hypothetical protein
MLSLVDGVGVGVVSGMTRWVRKGMDRALTLGR